MTTIAAVLRRNRSVERLDLELVLAHTLNVNRAAVIAHPELVIADELKPALNAALERLHQGEPMAYILGSKEFWGLTLRVDPRVLIPRPDTELIVETVLNRFRQPAATVLELGTGSGAIAIALAREGYTDITATDIAESALELAAQNAKSHGVALHLVHSNWFERIAGKYELIVSNPPYVGTADPHLDNLRHEPAEALVAGTDGLAALRTIIRDSPRHLKPGGMLLLEHGYDQACAVQQLLRQSFTQIVSYRDIAGHFRVTGGVLSVPQTAWRETTR